MNLLQELHIIRVCPFVQQIRVESLINCS